MVRELPPIEQVEQVCDGCMAGKQCWHLFPVYNNYRAAHCLELVHADLCGPIMLAKPDNKCLFLLIVDDNHYMCLTLLGSKDEAKAGIIRLQARVEAETGCKLGTMCTDCGGEFTTRAFNEYYAEQGVQWHLIAPFMPQHNGVVGRRNQTVLGMARSMMKAMRVSGFF
jgi:hypothetical protein